MRFSTTLQLHGKTATGIEIPPEVIAALGTSRKPPVRVTIAGHTYRSTVAFMGGVFLVGVNAENRAAAGVEAGQEIDVDIELDTAPREVVVPPDLLAALDAGGPARARFDALAYTYRKEWARSVEDAKTPETRRRRIAKAVAALSAD